MSDYRAVAAATQTLQNLLLEAIREAVPGATVKTGPPEVRPPEEVGEGLINIFLFKVEPNKVWRNEELPVRASDGSLIRRPMLAIDLQYLLSFYGDERRKIPYLLLGLALSALHAEPYPGLRHVPHRAPEAPPGDPADADPITDTLAGSGLEHQLHPLAFTLLPLSHDELIPLFSQIPFVMSVAFRASVLTIEPYGLPQPALPVRRADFYRVDPRRPTLTSIEPQVVPYSPAARIVLRGEGLTAPSSRILFGDLESEPRIEADGSLGAFLPVAIHAGTHLVRVAQTMTAEGPTPRGFAVESNPLALIVEPVVVEARQLPGPAAAPSPPSESPVPQAPVSLMVRFAPPVTIAGPLVVLLNEESAGEGRPPRAYALQTQSDPRTPDSVTVQGDVLPGTYLVRIQVNSVASRLSLDADSASPTFQRYTGPRLVIVGQRGGA